MWSKILNVKHLVQVPLTLSNSLHISTWPMAHGLCFMIIGLDGATL